jgi:hypothetical protein
MGEEHSPDIGFSLGFLFGFFLGSFGVLLFTTETGQWLLAKFLEMSEKKTKELLEEGKSIISEIGEADLKRFWHEELAVSDGEESEDGREIKKNVDKGKTTNRRFFRRG